MDAAPGPGGLACTDSTPEGFLFDMGGHVIFSHWDYFDRAVDAGLAAEAEAQEADEAGATAAAAAAATAAAAVASAGRPPAPARPLALTDAVVRIRLSGGSKAAGKDEEGEQQQQRATAAAAAAAAVSAASAPTPPSSSCSLWNVHQRVSYVWIRGRWVAYPFQNNLAALPVEDQAVCLEGLIEARCRQEAEAQAAAAAAAGASAGGAAASMTTTAMTTMPAATATATGPQTFDDWILRHLGRGIADLFMRPYNLKVWACAPRHMSASWLGERVPAADPGRALRNALLRREDAGWGPNAVFRFPKKGGTGAIWRGLARRLPADRQRYGDAAVRVDPASRTVVFASGRAVRYGALVSTLPLDAMLGMCGRADLAEGLAYSSTHVIGVGVRLRAGGPAAALAKAAAGTARTAATQGDAGSGAPSANADPSATADPSCPVERLGDPSAPACPLGNKCWMYFPEDDCPFYRATVFSNYAAANCPPQEAALSNLCRADGGEASATAAAGGGAPSSTGPYWSLMFEVSESALKPVDFRPTFCTPDAAAAALGGDGQQPPPRRRWPRVVLDTLLGAVATGLLEPDDEVVSLYHRRLERGYPTPTLGRDAALARALPWLRDEAGVWSRGRFGAWRYELGNQDHALLQGVEAADAALEAALGREAGGAERGGMAAAAGPDADVGAADEPTLRDADAANGAGKHATPVWDEFC